MFVSKKFMGDVPGYLIIGAPASGTACFRRLSFRAVPEAGAPAASAGAVPGWATSASFGRNEIETFIFTTPAKFQKPQRKCSQYGLILEQPAQNSILLLPQINTASPFRWRLRASDHNFGRISENVGTNRINLSGMLFLRPGAVNWFCWNSWNGCQNPAEKKIKYLLTGERVFHNLFPVTEP
jgi:hypothetical protein